ncbi:sulfurtransferase complex subunit TusC [Gallaecimonas sp. GXIMD1310]|uniref:sulfurtransferase complex subunit TusC n=1 Tax=Gallaecimonas sp. GXIMD1310 TaxID=3131926 RepID=UPI003247E9D9
MVEKHIGVIFSALPFANQQGREALDTVLAASAYEQPLSLFFIGDGVWQLVKDQQPEQAASKDYLATFKALSLYEVEHLYVQRSALSSRGLTAADLAIEVAVVDDTALQQLLARQDAIYRF